MSPLGEKEEYFFQNEPLISKFIYSEWVYLKTEHEQFLSKTSRKFNKNKLLASRQILPTIDNNCHIFVSGKIIFVLFVFIFEKILGRILQP